MEGSDGPLEWLRLGDGDAMKMLVVSEDALFVERIRSVTRSFGWRMISCLGPAHSECLLEGGDTCPLAEGAQVVLVDSPPEGVFARHWRVFPVGVYARDLARAHPTAFVILCGAPVGFSGPTGEVADVRDQTAALELIEWLASRRPEVLEAV